MSKSRLMAQLTTIVNSMSKITIAEAMSRSAGEIVPAFAGTVEFASEPRTGEGKYGPWTVQNVKVKDHTGAAVCSVWNSKTDFRELKGKSVSFQCTNKKGGLKGIAIKEGKDKDGNPRKELDISMKDAICFDGNTASAAAPAPAAIATSPVSAPASNGGGKDTSEEAKRTILTYMATWRFAFDAASHLKLPLEEQTKVATASVIECGRKGLWITPATKKVETPAPTPPPATADEESDGDSEDVPF